MKKMILSLVTVMTVLGTSVSYGRTVNKDNGKNTVKVENVQKVDNKSDKHKGNTKQIQDCNCTTCVELRKQESKKQDKKQTKNVTQKSDKKDTTYRFGNEQQNSNKGRTVEGVRK